MSAPNPSTSLHTRHHHIAAAEQLLGKVAARMSEGDDRGLELIVAVAQVHATLALAAAQPSAARRVGGL